MLPSFFGCGRVFGGFASDFFTTRIKGAIGNSVNAGFWYRGGADHGNGVLNAATRGRVVDFSTLLSEQRRAGQRLGLVFIKQALISMKQALAAPIA